MKTVHRRRPRRGVIDGRHIPKPSTTRYFVATALVLVAAGASTWVLRGDCARQKAATAEAPKTPKITVRLVQEPKAIPIAAVAATVPKRMQAPAPRAPYRPRRAKRQRVKRRLPREVSLDVGRAQVAVFSQELTVALKLLRRVARRSPPHQREQLNRCLDRAEKNQGFVGSLLQRDIRRCWGVARRWTEN